MYLLHDELLTFLSLHFSLYNECVLLKRLSFLINCYQKNPTEQQNSTATLTVPTKPAPLFWKSNRKKLKLHYSEQREKDFTKLWK